ncbi:Glycogen synthase [Rubripirellula lacrimiformis]|uniref:Glycogen synthase n=1 Tax=Rubripirellula lacrimiformis TaxID=1930273 RepID=A0A517NAJ9_9BACT|nr:glycosyltransferase family 4 protein [Rubripirellula lacrimiformis]QDT04161.1 Glycogen synthase [Rubripirellula lacrimiformis]
MKAVFLTAGAAGMYCGSCMHDNAIARAMIAQGVDCLLQPVYTPIRTDEISVASDEVFFGGIQIYLLQQMPWLRFVPGPLRRTLDWPPLLRWATGRTHSTDAAKLGDLAVSMLRGEQGRQASEVKRLAHWLADDIRPDAVLLSNLLIGGSLPAIRSALPNTRLAVMLQGDDIFLDFLPPKQRQQAIELCQELVPSVDRFIVHSQFYADKMQRMLNIPDHQLVVTPLSIDVAPFAETITPLPKPADEFRLGYLARIAPEKGLHHLVDAFTRLAADDEHHDMTLHAAGWLGGNHQTYLDDLHAKIEQASLSHRFTYHGSPSLSEKIAYLSSLDLLCVPTDYEDPKGLFVLEALAAGVPVLQPDHGAFGELITSTGGGQTYRPGNLDDLIRAIEDTKRNPQQRSQWAKAGYDAVHQRHSVQQSAADLAKILFD